ncbi:MAG: ISNCY family transposase, partial [Methylococcales bacterium]|nr:ISNCY family transposase [Methylococcales bacterium]
NKELDRLDLMVRIHEKRITQTKAATALGLSVRQVERLYHRYREDGPAGLTSRKRGRISNRKLSESYRDQVLTLIRKHYHDFGPAFACEKLLEQHGLKVSRETLRRWMIDAGLWTPRKQRRRVHQPRNRRECFGELIQIDGSDHHWFEDRAPRCTLLVFIDDATSLLTELQFVETESAFDYMASTRRHIERYGKPVAFYSDKHSIFHVNNKEAEGGAGITQFGRALSEINVDIICANTSQAKGRVERANLTLQDRLVKELRLAGISNRKAGNAFLEAFRTTSYR